MNLSWKTSHWRVNYTFPTKEHTHLVVDGYTTDYFVYPHYGVYCVGAVLGDVVVPLFHQLFTTEDEAKAALIALYRLGGIP